MIGTPEVLLGGLFAGYAPPAGAYDEMLTAEGHLRPPWQRFVRGLEETGRQGLAQRFEQTRRLLRENGVTYNVHGAPVGPDRAWELDPLPLLLSAREWGELAAAIAQRVTLLNHILVDFYGPQELLQRGVLPAKALFDHPGYLLPCHGISVPGDTFLHLYAGHLARQPDGTWTVVADRTQGPSGAGYALENRIVLSRTLPHDFHSLHVQRLAPFFIALRQSLLRTAAGQRDNPRVVLLSPGPRSATYFEDSYLSRYLGYTMVEGGDLTVRGHRVFLKTLGGLLPVDVILRRTPDEDADPLELRDSPLGVPGLLQAVRKGQVLVANAVGSGLLEAPVLMAFLPEICRCLLGEELKLPSVPTWWCGDEEHLRYVEAHFDELRVRPAFLHRSADPILVSRLTPDQRQKLLEQVRQHPEGYVAQADVARSTAPVWAAGTLQPWHVGLRAFAVAANDGYRVMPGGLSRLSPSTEGLGESVSAGQRSKDVWILSDAPVETTTLLQPPPKAIELRRSPYDLPSRVADNLFWLGRHAERAEGLVRHLRSVIVRMTNELEPAGESELLLLVEALHEPRERPAAPALPAAGILDSVKADLLGLIFDPRQPAGLTPTLESLRKTASHVRDRLSVDSWRIVNQLDWEVLLPRSVDRSRLGDVLLLLNHVLNLLSAFSGLSTESMTRGAGWRFLDMGRRIERAWHTLRLVRRTLVEPRAELIPTLEAVLEIADCPMTYRNRYLTSLQLAGVLDLVLVDETNPRSVGHQFQAIADHVQHLPREQSEPLRRPEQRITLSAQASLRLADVEALCEQDEHGARRYLDQFLKGLLGHLPKLSDSIAHSYLIHTGASRQLGILPMEEPPTSP